MARNGMQWIELCEVQAVRLPANEKIRVDDTSMEFFALVCDGKHYNDIGILLDEVGATIYKDVDHVYSHENKEWSDVSYDACNPPKDIIALTYGAVGETALEREFDNVGRYELLCEDFPALAQLATEFMDGAGKNPQSNVCVFIAVYQVSLEPEYGEYGSIEYYQPYFELIGRLNVDSINDDNIIKI